LLSLVTQKQSFPFSARLAAGVTKFRVCPKSQPASKEGRKEGTKDQIIKEQNSKLEQSKNKAENLILTYLELWGPYFFLFSNFVMYLKKWRVLVIHKKIQPKLAINEI
jgi:hypothetical protein